MKYLVKKRACFGAGNSNPAPTLCDGFNQSLNDGRIYRGLPAWVIRDDDIEEDLLDCVSNSSLHSSKCNSKTVNSRLNRFSRLFGNLNGWRSIPRLMLSSFINCLQRHCPVFDIYTDIVLFGCAISIISCDELFHFS